MYRIVRLSKIFRNIVLYIRHGRIISRMIQQPKTCLSAGFFFICVICNKQINMKTPFAERGGWKAHKEMNTHVRLIDKRPGKKQNQSSMFYFHTAGKGSSLNTGSKSSPSTKKSLPSASAPASATSSEPPTTINASDTVKRWFPERAHLLNFVKIICPYIFHFFQNTPPLGRNKFISFRM